MTTLDIIQAKIAKLQAQAEAIAKKQSSKVIAEIRDLMDRHGVTIADIEAHTGSKRGRKLAADKVATTKVAAKYRDPKSGATWTGRGRAPAWIADAKDRNKLLIDGAAESVGIAEKPAKPGNYVRGPQAPKYRDPQSGLTWSGRGRAPAWLADARDRAAFLIDGAGEGDGATKVVAAKKGTKSVATKKVGAKKAAAKKGTGTKVAGKKTVAKKAAIASKKSPAKKAAGKKAQAKKAAAKQSTAVAEAPAQSSASTSGGEGEAAA